MAETVRGQLIGAKRNGKDFISFADEFHQLRCGSFHEPIDSRIPVDSGPKILLHVVPESAYSEDEFVEFCDFGEERDIVPIFWRRSPTMTAIETGLVGYGGGNPDEGRAVTSYTLVIQNGIIEVVTEMGFDSQDGNQYLGTSLFETGISAVVADSTEYLGEKGTSFPLRINLSVLNVDGCDFLLERQFGYNSAPLEELIEPLGVTVESADVPVRDELDSLFRPFWLMLGHNESPYYDLSSSEWQGDAQGWFEEFRR